MRQIAIDDLSFADFAAVPPMKLCGGNRRYSISFDSSYSVDKDSGYVAGYVVNKQDKGYGYYWAAGTASAVASGIAYAIAVDGYTFANVNTNASAKA